MAGTFSHRGMLGFDTVATKSHHHQPVNATTLVLGWKLVTALGIACPEESSVVVLVASITGDAFERVFDHSVFQESIATTAF